MTKSEQTQDAGLASGTHVGMDESPTDAVRPAHSKKQQVCRFYGTKNDASHATQDSQGESADAPASSSKPRSQPDIGSAPRTVPRPTPRAQTEDPRAFQVGQIQRRFKPEVSETGDTSTFTFKMKPSDPDFPYEIDELYCILAVPKAYPHGKPSLRVTNQEIPRGFQLNIERGFDAIIAEAPEATLLGLMNRLDRQLETILAGQKADTIKLVVNRGPSQEVKAERTVPNAPSIVPAVQSVHKDHLETPTEQQRIGAQAVRDAHTRQLEARFGRLQAFQKTTNGLTYTIPLDSPKRPTWPASLQSLRSFTLGVPKTYPLESAWVHLDADSGEARRVEEAFLLLPKKIKNPTLTQLVNHLTQHLSAMATPAAGPITVPEDASRVGQPLAPNSKADAEQSIQPDGAKKQGDTETASQLRIQDNDRPHVHVIPRPPEWSYQPTPDVDDESDSSSLTSDDDVSSDEEKGEQPGATTAGSSAPAERGVLLSFPHIELHSIELLELVSLNITIKCERCKDLMDVERLRNYSGNASEMRQVTCKKCAIGLAVGFRTDLIHVNSARAGYLDFEGCTVIDLLPRRVTIFGVRTRRSADFSASTFLPTCSECSTPHPSPGVVAVRGDSTMAICRECHSKMSFRIPEVKFLQVSASAIRASRGPTRKKVKENLGITVGSELPRRGRCQHYSKSYRWFRYDPGHSATPTSSEVIPATGTYSALLQIFLLRESLRM